MNNCVTTFLTSFLKLILLYITHYDVQLNRPIFIIMHIEFEILNQSIWIGTEWLKNLD